MNGKVVGIGQIIIDVFKYYKVTFMAIISFLLTINTFTNLGFVAGIFVVIVIILILFDNSHIGISSIGTG
jgi:hypothetical protein